MSEKSIINFYKKLINNKNKSPEEHFKKVQKTRIIRLFFYFCINKTIQMEFNYFIKLEIYIQ